MQLSSAKDPEAPEAHIAAQSSELSPHLAKVKCRMSWFDNFHTVESLYTPSAKQSLPTKHGHMRLPQDQASVFMTYSTARCFTS